MSYLFTGSALGGDGNLGGVGGALAGALGGGTAGAAAGNALENIVSGERPFYITFIIKLFIQYTTLMPGFFFKAFLKFPVFENEVI